MKAQVPRVPFHMQRQTSLHPSSLGPTPWEEGALGVAETPSAEPQHVE